MKKLLVLSILVLTVFAVSNNLFSKQKVERDRLAEKGQPYDVFSFQRAYPNETVDLKKIDKAYETVLLDKLNKTNSNTPWTQQGPKNIGGRLNVVTLDPQNANIIYVGCSTGGVFRSLDAGASWTPIADALDYMAVSAIVLDPNDSNIIYIGTGDHNITGLPHVGNGIYKSTDGGNNWTHIGLTDQRIISRIKINPNNTQIIYAATMGLPFERNDDRGLYKSTDGGATWTQSLFVSDEVGIIDLVMDETRPDTLFASSWNRIRNNSESIVAGTESHIYRTYDGGQNWSLVENNLPMAEGLKVSRIGLDVSHQTPGKVYTLVVDTNFNIGAIASLEVGSDDWDLIPIDEDQMSNALGGFGWYFGQIRVNPQDDEEITILGVDMYSTIDSGSEWFRSTPPWWEYSVHADKHDLQYANDKIYLATDGGLYRANDLFSNWSDIEDLPNTQFYRVAVNPNNPGFYTGGAQDNGTTTGQMGVDWTRDRGGDGFQAIFDSLQPTLMYSETQNGGLAYKFEEDDNWSSCTFGIIGTEKKNWDMPWILSKHDNTVLYTGAQSMYRMNNAPMGNWFPISEDLTSGLSTGGRQHTISTVAESPLDDQILYAGETGGKIWRTLDQGGSWTEISDDLPTRYVTNIKASPYETDVVYVTLSGYKDNDNEAHIYKSEDNGDSWISISGDMGDFPVNHLEICNDTSLIVATDMGVYSTANYGANWTRVGNNMPIIPVFDIEIDWNLNILVAGTFARSIMTFPLDSLDTAPLPTSVKPIDAHQVNIFPNPADDYITAELKGHFDYQIFGIDGRSVIQSGQASDQQKIDVSQCTSGLYIIQIITGDKTYVSSFIKK